MKAENWDTMQDTLNSQAHREQRLGLTSDKQQNGEMKVFFKDLFNGRLIPTRI